MRSRVRSRLAMGAVLAATLGLTACGGLPAGAVVDVDGTAVSKQTYDRELRFVAFQAQGGAQLLSQKGTPFVVPDPPNFTRCIKQLGPLIKAQGGGQAVPPAQLKQQCKQFSDGIRDQTMQSLIVGEWARGEAKDKDLTVTDAAVEKQFAAEVIKQQFGGEKQFAQALKLTNFPRQQALEDFRTQVLFQKLQEAALKGKGDITPAKAKAFYDGNPRQFSTPAKRDLQIVLTDSEADAKKAATAIRGGRPFASVAKQYSNDQTTKSQGGKLQGATADQLDRALAKEVFAAKDGALVGPTQTSFGWYVVKAGKKTDAKKQPFATVQARLTQQLSQEEKTKAGQAWEKDVIKRWSQNTECRKGLEVAQLCGNAPASVERKAKAAQQQAAQQQAAGAAGAAGGAGAAGAAGAGGGAGTAQP